MPQYYSHEAYLQEVIVSVVPKVAGDTERVALDFGGCCGDVVELLQTRRDGAVGAVGRCRSAGYDGAMEGALVHQPDGLDGIGET